MDRNQKKALARLRELRATADSIDYRWNGQEKLEEWKLAVRSALTRLHGPKSRFLNEFEGTDWFPRVLYSGMPDNAREEAFLRGASNSRAIMSAAIREAEDYGQDEPGQATATVPKMNKKAFVVHGHDSEMKEAVARFLERLGVEAIILHEQASAGRTIIEKIEAHSDVAIAVVLLSPDDVGAAVAQRRKLRPRARQNVVLELGYFIGRLGRSRVCAIVRSEVELPSDVHGFVYVPFEGDAWKLQIVRELKAQGMDIDANIAF